MTLRRIYAGSFSIHLGFLLLSFIQPSNGQCNITFYTQQTNGSDPIRVEAHYYFMNETCGNGGNHSGPQIALWASRDSAVNTWLGIGASPTGKMCNSDMFTGHFSLNDGTALLVDRHATINERPRADNATGDVIFSELVVEDGKMVLRVIRPFTPSSEFLDEDVDFAMPQYMMLATGRVFSSETYVDGEIFYHGPNRRNSNRTIDFMTECRGCSCVASPSNGSVEFSNVFKYVPGAVATFYCEGGYALKGEKSITCGSDGEWSAPAPTCEALFSAGPCSVTGYRELDDEESRYEVRWGMYRFGLGVELSLHMPDSHWVGIGMQTTAGAPNGMCGADFITAYISRNGSGVQIEDRVGEHSGRPRLDNDVEDVFDKQSVVSDGKLTVFFYRLVAGPDDVPMTMTTHFLVASGYLAEDDENPLGTIAYHFESRMMFNRSAWRNVCPVCERPVLANGYVVGDEGVARFFYNEQITFACNRFYELRGPATRTCNRVFYAIGGNAIGQWDLDVSETQCVPLGLWENCSMEGRVNSTDAEPELSARWMYSPIERSLTVEIRRPIRAGQHRWVGFGLSANGTMCSADMTTAYFDLQNGTLHVQDRVSSMYGRPDVDVDQSQILRSDGAMRDGEMVVTFTRTLETTDTQDMQNLLSETTRLMFATGYVAQTSSGQGIITYHYESSWASPMEYNLTSDVCRGCSPLNELNDSHPIQYSDTLFFDGTTAVYTCNDTHVLVGASNNTCDDGDWTEADPVCRPPCVTPVPPVDGVLLFSGPPPLVYLDTATFGCTSGFDLCGQMTLTCLMNGEWNGEFPNCRLFCPVQNVSFAPGVREIDLDYGEAGSVLFLVPNPLTLGVGRLGSNGWERIDVLVSGVANLALGSETVASNRPESLNENRVTQANLTALDRPSTDLGATPPSTARFTFIRQNDKIVDLGIFMTTLAYVHSSSDDFSSRNITITITDIYGQISPTLHIRLRHIGTNDDPPVVSDTATLVNFTQGDDPLEIFQNSVTIEDPDHPSFLMRDAQCEITAEPSGSYDSADERLGAANCSSDFNITFDSASGILSINGPGTDDEFQTCFNSITYHFRGEVYPSVYRDILCVVSDGLQSASLSVRVMLLNVNDRPRISLGETFTFNYTQYGPPLHFLDSLAIEDDGTILTRATLRLFLRRSVGLTDADDIVALPPTPNGLSVVNETIPGFLGIPFLVHIVYDINGEAPIAVYEAYLKGIRFEITKERPYEVSDGERVVSLSVRDSDLTSDPFPDIKINVYPVNDAPILQFDSSADPNALPSEAARLHTLVFREDGPPVDVTPSTTTLRDVDSVNMNRLRCDFTQLRDGFFETLTIDEDYLAENGLNFTYRLLDQTRYRLEVIGSANVSTYLTAIRSLKYSNQRDELKIGNRLVICVVEDDGGAISEQVHITIQVESTNDAIDVSLGAPVARVHFTEGQQQGVYVIPSPHRLIATDAENHLIKRVEFTLVSDPPGYLDNLEYLFLIKDVPEGLTMAVGDSLKTLTFEGNVNLTVLLDLARRLFYFNQEDEPAMFVNETVPLKRYVVMRVCDTGDPPAVTTIMIEIVIQTVNDHAPTIVASCLTSRPRSRSRRETQTFKIVKGDRLSVIGLNFSASHMVRGRHLNVTFSSETNQPAVSQEADLCQILTIYPTELANVGHFGLWQSADTLTIVFAGKAEPISSSLVRVAFESLPDTEGCRPETDCLIGVCSVDGLTCPVVGSYPKGQDIEDYSSAAIGGGVEEISEDNPSVPLQTSLYEWEVGALAMIGVIILVALAVIIAFKSKNKKK